jgi:hypothetical protein
MPIHLWCQLLPQVERQLLLLRQSQAHPNLSAYAHVYEHHDYNWHPFVPISMEALVHDKPHKHRTYAEHCTKAFCPGHVHQTLSMLEILDPHNTRHTHPQGSLFQTQIPNQPIGHAGGSSNCGSRRLTNALQGINQPQLNTSTLQALSDLRNVFYKAANATNAPGKQVTNKEVKIWDQSPTKDRPNKEVEIWDQSSTKDRRVTFTQI